MTLPQLNVLPFTEQAQFDQLDNADYDGFLAWLDGQDDEEYVNECLNGAYRYLTQQNKELDSEFWRKHYVAISISIESLGLEKFSGLKNQFLVHLRDLSTLLTIQQIIADAKDDIANDDYASFVARAYSIVNIPSLKLTKILQATWMLMRQILNSTDDVRFVVAMFSGISEVDNNLARLTLEHAKRVNHASETPIVAESSGSASLGEYEAKWVGFDTIEIEERDTTAHQKEITDKIYQNMGTYSKLWNSHFRGYVSESSSESE